MGSACVSRPKSNEHNPDKPMKAQAGKSQSNVSPQKIDKRQVELLKLIYKDLASRSVQRELTMQIFLQFFHKNGYWGERLFKQFDTTNTTSITQSQFINGITKIFKTTEQKKIGKLYKFFSEGNMEQGISFSNFLKMLYNYPKQDLKIILDDPQFINKEVKQYLVAVDAEINGRRLQSLSPTDMKNGVVNGKAFRLSESQSNSEWRESKFVEKFHSDSNVNRDHHTSWKIAIGENDVEVKTTSIHHLVKKYAKSIFKSYKIDEKTGKFGYKEFKDWITSHKNLYNVYYEGFHCEAWQFKQNEQCPTYLTEKMEYSSKARILMEGRQKNVNLYLIHSILIVCEEENKTHPIYIICLEGLTVSEVFDNKYGNGIQIMHRDGYYQLKKIFFINEGLQQEWLEHLKYYKGLSINQIYDIKEKIGTGRFSIVYNGIEKSTNESYAIKQITVQQLDNEAKSILSHETNVMKVLSHPLLVFFKETVATKTHIYIITELVRGKDLFELVHDYKHLQENEAAFVMEQVIVGVRYINSLGIVHRDLKPENIMVQFDSKTSYMGRVKIIDFGFADYISHLQEVPKQQLLVGTPNYIAPEILRSEPFDEKIDNFAIGGILYYLLSGTYPFGNKDTISILTRTMLGQYTLDGKRWQKVSDEAKDLVEKLLQTNQNERISLEDALNHPWFEKYKQKQSKNGIKLSKKVEEEKGEKRMEESSKIQFVS